MSTSRRGSSDSSNSDDFVQLAELVEQSADELRAELEKVKLENEKLKKVIEEAKASQEQQALEAQKKNEEISSLQQHEKALQDEIQSIKQKQSETAQINLSTQQEIKILNENLFKEKEKNSKLEAEALSSLDKINFQFDTERTLQAGRILTRAYFSKLIKKKFEDLATRFVENKKNISKEKANFVAEQMLINNQLLKLSQQANPKESITQREARMSKTLGLLQEQSNSYSHYTAKLKPFYQVYVDLLTETRFKVKHYTKRWLKMTEAVANSQKVLKHILTESKQKTDNYCQNHLTIFGGSKGSRNAEFLKAIADKQFNKAKKLLTAGNANIDTLRSDGLTSLQFQMIKKPGSNEMSWLLENGANPAQVLLKPYVVDNTIIDHAGSTLLHLFCKHHFYNDDLKKLLDTILKVVDVNHQDDKGNTASHCAASFQKLDHNFINYLKKAGAKTDIKNKAGEIPADLYCPWGPSL